MSLESDDRDEGDPLIVVMADYQEAAIPSPLQHPHDPDPSDKENPSTVKTRLKKRGWWRARKRKKGAYASASKACCTFRKQPKIGIQELCSVGQQTVAVGVEGLVFDTGCGTCKATSALK